MPSPSPLTNVDALLAPVTDKLPVAELDARWWEFRNQFETANNAADTEKPKLWPEVIASAREYLKRTGKHLGVVARLTVALTELHGFPGLGAGLDLLAQLCANCWADLLPPGPAERKRVFADLDNPSGVWFFPNVVELVPIVRGKEGNYGLHHLASNPPPGTNADDVRHAVAKADPRTLRLMSEDLQTARAALGRLRAALEAALPGDAPALFNLGGSLEQCQKRVDEICPPPAPKPDGIKEETAPGMTITRVLSPPREGATWDDLLNQLEQLAAALERINHQSPVPYVVRHAVALGRLPFPALMRKLSRSEEFIMQLHERYDIPREPTGDAPAGET